MQTQIDFSHSQQCSGKVTIVCEFKIKVHSGHRGECLGKLCFFIQPFSQSYLISDSAWSKQSTHQGIILNDVLETKVMKASILFNKTEGHHELLFL